MHRTLAVSYRWMEDRQICLIEDVTISMSDFEMQTVVEAIRTTNCRYVWIDKIAVPQAEQIIQAYRQLASRTLCSKDEDKLRAMWPMLSNTPVENHEELLTLVNAISATAPRDSLDNAAMSALTTKVRYSFVDITSGARARRRQSISIADGKSMRKRAK
eukprot:jgi/Tetstr1/427262/TSEL_017447.t1